MAAKKNSAATTGNKQAPTDKPMHKCGQCEPYGTLCNSGKASRADRSRVWERDHIPAKATLFRRALKLRKDMKPKHYACVKSKLEYRGMAVVIPRPAHRAASPTCGNLNKSLMKDDASSAEKMQKAIDRDTAAMQVHLGETDCAEEYEKAAAKIKEHDVDKMVRETVDECKAEVG